MKRLLIFFSLFFVGLSVEALNTLSLNSTQGHPGDTVTLTLSLSNSDAVTAMQTFIPLGGQLSYVTGSATLSNRSNGHQLTATVLRDTLRIYSYSLGLNSFTGNSGALLTFRVVLGKEPGNYSLPLLACVLSSATGNALSVTNSNGTVTILAPKISISPSSIDYGHCPIRSTYTRNVTVYNIGNEPLTMSSVTFDENTLGCTTNNITINAGGQQTVTISYLPVTAGTVTLHGLFHSNAKVGDSILTIYADPYAVNELRPLSVSGYTDSIVTVQLRLNNMDSIVALQTSVKLPEALTYIPGSFAIESSRSQGHVASVGLNGDTLTMLLTNIENRPLRDGDGVVASFQLRLHGYGSYTLHLLGTVLVDSAERNVLSAVYSGTVYIYSPSLSCNSTLSLGSTPVTDTAEALFTIRNYGNAPLTIERVLFTSNGYSVAETMPLTIGNYQNATLHVRYSGTTAGYHSTLMQIYNNDPRVTLYQVVVNSHRYEPNDLFLTTNPSNGIDNATVSVSLDNYSAITALQFDLEYPYQYASVENTDFQLTERANGHFLSSARQNDSTWRVLLLSMQNTPLYGNSGNVLDVRMHLLDTNDLYPHRVALHNVVVAGANGVNMLTSIDSVVYVATRLQTDTLYVHDTTTVIQIDTVVRVDYIHDTTVVTQIDTVVRVDYVHDTTVVTQIDTVIRLEYIHDTTVITLTDTVIQLDYVFDTIYSWLHDTTVVTNTVYDTLYINNYIHDTTVVTNTVYDTTYINNYIHDTTYVTNTVHDTTFIDNYITIHDTTYVDVIIHDTITITDTVTVELQMYTLSVVSANTNQGLVAGNGEFPAGTVVEIAAIPIEGNRFVSWNDGNTDNPRQVTLSESMSFTASFGTVGTETVMSYNFQVYAAHDVIVVENADGQRVRIFDAVGRQMAVQSSVNDTYRYQVPASGVYLIQVGDYPARKVTIVK